MQKMQHDFISRRKMESCCMRNTPVRESAILDVNISLFATGAPVIAEASRTDDLEKDGLSGLSRQTEGPAEPP